MNDITKRLRRFVKNMTPLDKLVAVLAIQNAPGNGRDDPETGYVANDYMRGMANGLILAEHIMRDRHGDPDYVPLGPKHE